MRVAAQKAATMEEKMDGHKRVVGEGVMVAMEGTVEEVAPEVEALQEAGQGATAAAMGEGVGKLALGVD